MPSESIAELPVKKAAINLVAAMATLPAMAAKIAVLDSGTMRYTIANEAARAESSEKTIRPSGLHQNRERTGVPKPGVPGAAERGPRPSISAGVPCALGWQWGSPIGVVDPTGSYIQPASDNSLTERPAAGLSVWLRSL